MKKRRAVYLVLTAAMLCFIWGNSAMSGAASGALSGRFLKYLAPLFAPLGNKAEFVLRNLAHFSEFTLLETPKIWLTRPLFLGLTAACIDETIQIYSPGRASSLLDVWIDFSGVTLGVLVSLLVYGLLSRKK